MKYGFLSGYFESVAVKRLTDVEIDPGTSNQHELNGSEPVKQILGLAGFQERPATFIWLGRENEGISEEAWVTWYDSRKGQPHRSPEWRLYYPSNSVIEMARTGDMLVLARRPGGHLMLIVASDETTKNQLAWLFGVRGNGGSRFSLSEFGFGTDRQIDFSMQYVLDEIGVAIEDPSADRLDGLIQGGFSEGFPSTRELSRFARETLRDPVDPREDPDHALLAWLAHEQAVFRRLERRDVGVSAERRLCRLGSATHRRRRKGGRLSSLLLASPEATSFPYVASAEHHLAAILDANSVSCARAVRTEGWLRSDFLFPGDEQYHDPTFPVERLTVLGARATCQDRWREALSSAVRVRHKHLMTLEPGISVDVTDQMRSNRLQLVVPRGIHPSYTSAQRAWLMTASDFVTLVADRQRGR